MYSDSMLVQARKMPLNQLVVFGGAMVGHLK
jgi:hypothetical protein